jgi:hypothetical protein
MNSAPQATLPACIKLRASLPPRGRSTSKRERSAKRRSPPNIRLQRRFAPTSPACFKRWGTLPRHGRYTSGRSQSTRRRSARTTPIRPKYENNLRTCPRGTSNTGNDPSVCGVLGRRSSRIVGRRGEMVRLDVEQRDVGSLLCARIKLDVEQTCERRRRIRIYLRLEAASAFLQDYKTCIIALARKFLRFLFAFYWKKTIVFAHEQQPAPALVLSAIGGAIAPQLSTV